MIALWMLYGLGVATLLAAAAACLERALRTAGRAARGVWAAALTLSLAAPAGAWVVASESSVRPR